MYNGIIGFIVSFLYMDIMFNSHSPLVILSRPHPLTTDWSLSSPKLVSSLFLFFLSDPMILIRISYRSIDDGLFRETKTNYAAMLLEKKKCLCLPSQSLIVYKSLEGDRAFWVTLPSMLEYEGPSHGKDLQVIIEEFMSTGSSHLQKDSVS